VSIWGDKLQHFFNCLYVRSEVVEVHTVVRRSTVGPAGRSASIIAVLCTTQEGLETSQMWRGLFTIIAPTNAVGGDLRTMPLRAALEVRARLASDRSRTIIEASVIFTLHVDV
jgi:hypothetical protein